MYGLNNKIKIKKNDKSRKENKKNLTKKDKFFNLFSPKKYKKKLKRNEKKKRREIFIKEREIDII